MAKIAAAEDGRTPDADKSNLRHNPAGGVLRQELAWRELESASEAGREVLAGIKSVREGDVCHGKPRLLSKLPRRMIEAALV